MELCYLAASFRATVCGSLPSGAAVSGKGLSAHAIARTSQAKHSPDESWLVTGFGPPRLCAARVPSAGPVGDLLIQLARPPDDFYRSALDLAVSFVLLEARNRR